MARTPSRSRPAPDPPAPAAAPEASLAAAASAADRSDADLHLPPHRLLPDDGAAVYEGDAPNVLADHLLLQPHAHAHAHHPASTSHPHSTPGRPPIGSRNSSWHSALFATHLDDDGGPQGSAQGLARSGSRASSRRRRRQDPTTSGDRTFSPSARPGYPAAEHASDHGEGAPEEEEEDEDGQGDDEHARSRRHHRKLKWYRRPSPIWFFPGTLVAALTMGMTIAPKLEIYNQLICRTLPVDQSGVTVPPPVLELGGATGGGAGPVWDKHPSSADRNRSLSATWVQFEAEPGAGSNSQSGHRSGSGLTKRAASPISSDGEWVKQCHKSRAVQSQVARLALLLSLLMGVLSSLTTGYWGAFSDRRGRKPVLVLALCGSLAMDVVFLLTVYYHETLGYGFLLVGPFLDGLVGGWSTAQAASAAYISDVTAPGSRAKIFSAIGGLMYGGFALGPVLGSLLVQHSRLKVLAPFYAALGMHAAYLLFLAALLPESLSLERRRLARERHERERKERRQRREGTKGWGRVRAVLARPLSFLQPLELLLPRRVHAGPGEAKAPEDRTNIEWGAHLSEYWDPREVWKSPDPNRFLATPGGQGAGAGRADWTLTKIAAAWACYMTLMAVMSVKLLYANYTFGWQAAEDGYYLSFLGILRVVMLVGLIPLAIKLVRRAPAPVPMRPRPLSNTDAGKVAGQEWDAEARWLRVVHDSHFDLALARWSLSLDLCGFLLFLLAPYLLPASLRGQSQHVALFLTAAVLQSMGSGASPAIQSLALAHASPRDSGRLFASWSVVQSISSQVLGPILFSTVFMQTVGRWSEAIFALASALAALAVLALSLVRLRRVVAPTPTPTAVPAAGVVAADLDTEAEAAATASRASISKNNASPSLEAEPRSYAAAAAAGARRSSAAVGPDSTVLVDAADPDVKDPLRRPS